MMSTVRRSSCPRHGSGARRHKRWRPFRHTPQISSLSHMRGGAPEGNVELLRVPEAISQVTLP
jgi:hypothetical protein